MMEPVFRRRSRNALARRHGSNRMPKLWLAELIGGAGRRLKQADNSGSCRRDKISGPGARSGNGSPAVGVEALHLLKL
jgi:hypothetical protein